MLFRMAKVTQEVLSPQHQGDLRSECSIINHSIALPFLICSISRRKLLAFSIRRSYKRVSSVIWRLELVGASILENKLVQLTGG